MEDTSLVALLARLAVSLGVLLALMVAAGRLLRRQGLGSVAGTHRRHAVEVLARQGVGRSASVTVVRAGDRALVLGVTESSVRLLVESDLDAFVVPEADRTSLPGRGPDTGRANPAWKTVLDALRDRTVRRP